jgi:phytol kinase|tara:strand:+ start:4486 stop:5691 length:1206 start_codon:yes stop_codon:yes gene_type:complete
MNILIVIALLVALMLVVHNLPLCAEASRKSIHLGMGMICLGFPWLFSTPLQVDLLAALAVSTLLIIRWKKTAVGKVLHGIKRLSFGELLFPVGVAIVFRLSSGDLSTYLPAIGVLTFADTAGALVGERFGKHLYRTNAGQKSLEGSLAVFIVSFLIVWLAGISSDPLTAFMIAIVVALVATMAEGVLGAGIDNLVLPISVFALIFLLRDLTWSELLSRITLISAVGLFLFTVRRITSLNGGGLLSATIFAYLSFALGGPKYLLAPTLLFLIHLITTWRHPKLAAMEHSANSISAIALPGLIWVTLKSTTDLSPDLCYHGFCLTLMAHTAFLHSVTRAHLQLPSSLTVGAAKVIAVTVASGLWWFAPLAALFLILSIPHTRSLNRLDQAILAFLFSLLTFMT